MRTPILAAVLGLSLVGCFVGDEGTPAEGDDDTTPETPSQPVPSNAQVDITVDKATMATELKTANVVAVTVKGSNGFSGNVALAASVVDATGATLDWTVSLSQPSVNLAANGTATVMATVNIPTKTAGLAGMLKISSTSAAKTGTTTASSAITAANQITWAVKVDAATGKCVYPADAGTAANPVVIAQGTKVRFFNSGTADLVIHSGGVISHQGQAPNGLADPTTETMTAYEQMPTGTGSASWYCHAPATDLGAMDPRFTVQ